MFLALSRGPVLVSDLARDLDVSRQAVHKLLDGLEAEGLVDRRRDEHDRRAQRVGLTGRGRELAGDAGRILPQLERELAERIGDDNVEALRTALARDRGPSPTQTDRGVTHRSGASPATRFTDGTTTGR